MLQGFYCIFQLLAFSSFWISMFNLTHVRTGVCQATPLDRRTVKGRQQLQF